MGFIAQRLKGNNEIGSIGKVAWAPPALSLIRNYSTNAILLTLNVTK